MQETLEKIRADFREIVGRLPVELLAKDSCLTDRISEVFKVLRSEKLHFQLDELETSLKRFYMTVPNGIKLDVFFNANVRFLFKQISQLKVRLAGALLNLPAA